MKFHKVHALYEADNVIPSVDNLIEQKSCMVEFFTGVWIFEIINN
jgi:hypothetical protein